MNKHLAQTFIVLLLVGLGIAFFAFDLNQYFNLDTLKKDQQLWQTYYENQPWLVMSIFSAVYILCCSLAVPGVTLLSLAAGALFGFWKGALIVSFSSTLGATVALLLSRFLLRDFIQSKFAKKLSLINEGIDKEGIYYLFSLRLIPVFPFFIVNLAMGLTSIKASQFFWVSQLGMLPATLAYVNAGKQLSQVSSVKGILSVPLLLSFALLGVLPLITKKVVDGYRARRVSKPTLVK